jgi:ubiquinone/menaquinone biosynthesis C-methylase UbiE
VPSPPGAPHRDVAAFEERAATYEQGRRGALHRQIAERAAALALAGPAATGAPAPGPRRVLDVGCGTGYFLRLLATRCPDARELTGVDPAPTMVRAAAAAAPDGRLHFSAGVFAEHLPYPDATFDLVVSTTSFDHWSDQGAGLAECARVMTPGGRLVLVDQFSMLLAPTLVFGRRGKARTRRRADRLLAGAGLRRLSWHRLYAVIIQAVVATKPG